jgi:hypothetical protein
MSPLRSHLALAVLALTVNALEAGDYDHGPVWTYRRGDGVQSFGGSGYSNGKDGYPAATLRFPNLRSKDVKGFGVTNKYSVFVVKGTNDYVIVWHYSESGEDEARGVYRIKFADGVELDRSSINRPGMDLLFLKEVRGLKSLELSGLRLNKADLGYLAGLKKLESLRLAKSTGTDNLPGSVNKNLKRLELPYCDLTDVGLARLARLEKLRELDLSWVRGITQVGLERLTALKGLRKLTLYRVDVPAKAVEALSRKLPKGARVLWLPGRSQAERDALKVLLKAIGAKMADEGTKPVTSLGFGVVWSGGVPREPNFGPAVMDAVMTFQYLEELGVRGPQFTDQHLERLKGLPRLKSLYIGPGSAITDAGLAHLKAFPALTRLSLEGLPKVTNAGLAHLKEVKKLKNLELQGIPKITNAGLVHLKGIKKLEELSLEGRQFTNAAAIHLGRLKSLKILALHETGCTKEVTKRLRKALPKTTLYIYIR